jgi:predicted TIM-barrel fold metal-dependent hydrolase
MPSDSGAYALISSDSHVIEPPDLWTERLPEGLRDRAPTYPAREVGNVFQAHEGGWDPVARVKEMAVDGVSGEVLYPSLAMDQYGINDQTIQEACFRVYNDWLIEYCAYSPDRLFGVGMIATFDPRLAVAELERCKKAGLRGAMIWQVPPDELSFASDHYEPFWQAAQDLELPVSLHILTGKPYPPGAVGGGGRRTAVDGLRSAVNAKVFYAMNALSDITCSGVLERFPRLQVVLVENEVSWLPFVLTQWDKYWNRGTMDGPLTVPPSEYFQRQVHATFFNDPPTHMLFPDWGLSNCMWSNDFPHPNSTWPHSRDVIQRDLGDLSSETRKRLVHDNVVELYRLPVIAPLAEVASGAH